MGNFVKWLGAGLGFAVGGPIGSVLGFVVGNFIDGFSREDIERARTFRTSGSNVESGDFEISLLLLSAVVIKADGKVNQTELSYVRNHFKSMYGEERASHAFKLFNGFIKNNNFSTRQVCMQIRQNMTHASRLQLVHFLFGIAKADSNSEATQAGTIKGKLSYLAPEYLDGLELDPRYDIFATGITLWEMLTGRKLFTASNDSSAFSLFIISFFTFFFLFQPWMSTGQA